MATMGALQVDSNTIDPTTGHGPEWGKAAPIGLLVIVLMGIAVYFLLKSMNRNLKKVPASFDPPPDRPAPAGSALAGSGSGSQDLPETDRHRQPAGPVVIGGDGAADPPLSDGSGRKRR